MIRIFKHNMSLEIQINDVNVVKSFKFVTFNSLNVITYFFKNNILFLPLLLLYFGGKTWRLHNVSFMQEFQTNFISNHNTFSTTKPIFYV